MQPVEFNIEINKEPLTITINLDEIYGRGIGSIRINVDGRKFVFTKDEIKELLQKFKRGLPRY